MKKSSVITSKPSQDDPAAVAEQLTARHSRSRRRLLQSLAAGGAAVSVKALPERWARPVLDVSMLPAHARASCQAESLNCRVNTIDYAYTGSVGDPHETPPPPYSGGQSATIDRFYVGRNGCAETADGRANSATLSVNATVDPACGPVDLVSSLVVNEGTDEFALTSGGGTQNGVVDPDNGVVAFNNLIVAINLPNPSVGDGATVNADLDLSFNAPGVPPCVINITFTEITEEVGGC